MFYAIDSQWFARSECWVECLLGGSVLHQVEVKAVLDGWQCVRLDLNCASLRRRGLHLTICIECCRLLASVSHIESLFLRVNQRHQYRQANWCVQVVLLVPNLCDFHLWEFLLDLMELFSLRNLTVGFWGWTRSFDGVIFLVDCILSGQRSTDACWSYLGSSREFVDLCLPLRP